MGLVSMGWSVSAVLVGATARLLRTTRDATLKAHDMMQVPFFADEDVGPSTCAFLSALDSTGVV